MGKQAIECVARRPVASRRWLQEEVWRPPGNPPFRSDFMEIQPGLTRIGAVDAEAIRSDAERAGYTTFVLPAQGITDKASSSKP